MFEEDRMAKIVGIVKCCPQMKFVVGFET